MPVTVAVRSRAWVLAGWLLGSWVRIPLKAWMFVRVFLCCVVLCRQRPCDGLITRPRSPTICLNSSRNLLYARRPRSFKECRATGKKSNKIISYDPHFVILFVILYLFSSLLSPNIIFCALFSSILYPNISQPGVRGPLGVRKLYLSGSRFE
jgi:hypothetical protein